MKRVITALCLLGALCANAKPMDTKKELSFMDPIDFDTGRSPQSVAVGDFNQDGIPDLAVANRASNTVPILLGKGDGGFERLPLDLMVETNPQFVAVDDFNGDGIQDLAVANNGSNNISVLLGNGDGSFQPAVNYAAGTGPVSIAVGDFNGDGIQDLAVANRASNSVSILLGRGNGTFALATNLAVGGGATFVAVGDFNGDGIQDLAVTTVDSSRYVRGTLSILLGNGDGTFHPTGQQPPLAVGRGGVASIAVGDFDGNGVLDLAVTGSSTATVSVLRGIGDGTFTAFTPTGTYQVGGIPLSIAVGDFNRDGIPDLVIASQYSAAAVLLGNGDGTFQTTHYWGGANPSSVAVGDFNGDGLLDLAITQNFSNQVSIFLNDGFQPGDGVRIVRDIVYYSGRYFNRDRENLDVYVPPGVTDFPVVFLTFGGQFRNNEKSTLAYLARTLAREGLGVVAINYRTTDGSYAQVVHPGHAVDAARALAWTYNHIAEYGGNPSKIVLVGHSSGGTLVSLLATDRHYLADQKLSPDVIRGVIGVSAGLYDFSQILDIEDVFGDQEQRWGASPLRYVDGSQPPFLVLYGGNDNPGFAEDSTAFYQALINAGSEAELHMIPDRTHPMIIANSARRGDPARALMLRFIADHAK